MAFQVDVQSCFDTAKLFVEQAGALIVAAFHEAKNVQRKGAVDLVTDTDKASEELIVSGLRAAFPDHQFLAEEAFSATGGSAASFTDEPTWIIDPVDGTTNFVHRYPFVAVSCALAVNREIVLGIVFNPIMKEMFTALRGQGAFLNGERIKINRVEELPDALVGTNIGHPRYSQFIEFCLGNVRNLLQDKVQSIRSSGSAACDMCSVACGRLDCYYEVGIWPWDIAAGKIIAEEAGAAVLNLDGTSLVTPNREVLVGHEPLIRKIATYILPKPPLDLK
eukprot:GILJ01004785.1.p1 GENE.GILJ01004785.1~~GILJ01004785.1.p1  ORF type:complete len:278 (-),score=46.76 GILJ01004785.1:180-1013(-)